jgi:FAD/FMN-containing dehydrogenase
MTPVLSPPFHFVPSTSHRAAAVAGWPALLHDLRHLGVDESAISRERAAADYHWYSPVLAQQLAGRLPHGVVRPATQQQVLDVAAACARHHVPLTVRGGGTGNYGQCVPLFGGLTLDMTAVDQVLRVEPGWAVVQAGALMGDVNTAVRASGQQLRMWPSTEKIATIGGFIAGGHSGIGSMRHGILADPGNVRRLRVVTLQDPPQVIDLLGADIQQAHHAYGSNGILLEVEVALTAWVPWLHTLALFDSYAAVLDFGLAAGAAAVQGDIDLFQLTAVERRITPFYAGLQQHLQAHPQQQGSAQDGMFAQVAPASAAAYAALVAQHGGRVALQGTEEELHARSLPSATECAYNHTTLEALKTDRSFTYLQVAYPAPLSAALVAQQMQRFGDEVYMHHEFSRSGGQLVAFALPLVQYFDEAQLQALMHSFEADGCHIFNPHTWVLEDGGMKQVDEAQLAFKQRADPMGLMNPGKVRGWDERVLGIPGGQL